MFEPFKEFELFKFGFVCGLKNFNFAEYKSYVKVDAHALQRKATFRKIIRLISIIEEIKILN